LAQKNEKSEISKIFKFRGNKNVRAGEAFKHSPFRAASPAGQPRALGRLGAPAARLFREILSRFRAAAVPRLALGVPVEDGAKSSDLQ
jgi:hypothetical protein